MYTLKLYFIYTYNLYTEKNVKFSYMHILLWLIFKPIRTCSYTNTCIIRHIYNYFM